MDSSKSLKVFEPGNGIMKMGCVICCVNVTGWQERQEGGEMSVVVKLLH